ncbi:hypothetical protein Gotur_035619 [Gossypium turneri]
MLVELGQSHLFQQWTDPGVEDDKKKAFFAQSIAHSVGVLVVSGLFLHRIDTKCTWLYGRRRHDYAQHTVVWWLQRMDFGSGCVGHTGKGQSGCVGHTGKPHGHRMGVGFCISESETESVSVSDCAYDLYVCMLNSIGLHTEFM